MEQGLQSLESHDGPSVLKLVKSCPVACPHAVEGGCRAFITWSRADGDRESRGKCPWGDKRGTVEKPLPEEGCQRFGRAACARDELGQAGGCCHPCRWWVPPRGGQDCGLFPASRVRKNSQKKGGQGGVFCLALLGTFWGSAGPAWHNWEWTNGYFLLCTTIPCAFPAWAAVPAGVTDTGLCLLVGQAGRTPSCLQPVSPSPPCRSDLLLEPPCNPPRSGWGTSCPPLLQMHSPINP